MKIHPGDNCSAWELCLRRKMLSSAWWLTVNYSGVDDRSVITLQIFISKKSSLSLFSYDVPSCPAFSFLRSIGIETKIYAENINRIKGLVCLKFDNKWSPKQKACFFTTLKFPSKKSGNSDRHVVLLRFKNTEESLHGQFSI